MASPRAIWTLCLAAALGAFCRGSVDEFQCACGYDARDRTRQLRAMVGAGRDADAVDSAADYGALVARMLFVAYSRPEPTARWLWLLNVFANTVRRVTRDSPRAGRAELVLDGLGRVRAELDGYVDICRARGFATGARWPRDTFEKYVLENVASIVQAADSRDGVRVADFDPARLYLNDVAADAARLGDVLPERVGVDWGTAAGQLSRVYGLARANWLAGTRQLVLFHKRFLSAVAASMMGYVLVHVTRCQRHWSSHFRRAAVAAADDDGLVSEYERVWMSVGALLDKFKSYLALGPEKYFGTLTELAANPVWDDHAFRRVTRTIETNIVAVGAGAFGFRAVRAAADGATLAVANTETPFIELVALVDNNISAAEKYLQRVKDRLSGVDFRVINDFMRSTHIWLT